MIFLKKVWIDKIKSFLATNLLPQFGQLDKKEMYSFILVLFQLCEQEKHFIKEFKYHALNKKPNKSGAFYFEKVKIILLYKLLLKL